jgi:hypothetical protein
MSEDPTVHSIPPHFSDSPFGSEIDMATPEQAMLQMQQHLAAYAAENQELRAAAAANAAAAPGVAPPPAAAPEQVFGKPPKIPDPATFNGNSNDLDRFVEQARFWVAASPN